MKTKEEQKHFLSLLQRHFIRLRQKGQEESGLFLCAYNHINGIGDLTHLRDFYDLCQKYLNENGLAGVVDLRAMVFLTPKRLPLATILLNKLKNQFYIFRDDEDDAFNPPPEQTFIIYVDPMPQKLKESSIITTGYALRHQKELTTYISNHCRNLINVSRPVDSDTVSEIGQTVCPALSKDTYIQSIQEYGIYADPIVLGNGNEHYDVYSMGLASTEVGIKMYPDFLGEEKLNNVDAINNSNYLKQLLNLNTPKDIEDYRKHHVIGYGYFQNEGYLEKFVLTLLAISEGSKSIDVLANDFYIEKIIEKIDSPDSPLRKMLAENQISSVNYNGKVILINNTSQKVTRELRFFNISGIAETDKIALMLASDANAGSGDTSYSEVFSSAKFPFFQSRQWKDCFFVGMLKDIAELERTFQIGELGELKTYLKILLGLSFDGQARYQERGASPTADDIQAMDDEAFFKFIQANWRQIEKQYQNYCRYVEKKRNAISAQTQMIERALVVSVLTRGTDLERDELLKIIPDWRIDDNHFVLVAASTGNSILLQYLFAKDQRKFTELLFEKHRFHKNSKSPLEFILRNNLFKNKKLLEDCIHSLIVDCVQWRNEAEIIDKLSILYSLMVASYTSFTESFRDTLSKLARKILFSDTFTSSNLNPRFQIELVKFIKAPTNSELTYIKDLLSTNETLDVAQSNIISQSTDPGIIKLFLLKNDLHDDFVMQAAQNKNWKFIQVYLENGGSLNSVKIAAAGYWPQLAFLFLCEKISESQLLFDIETIRKATMKVDTYVHSIKTKLFANLNSTYSEHFVDRAESKSESALIKGITSNYQLQDVLLLARVYRGSITYELSMGYKMQSPANPDKEMLLYQHLLQITAEPYKLRVILDHLDKRIDEVIDEFQKSHFPALDAYGVPIQHITNGNADFRIPDHLIENWVSSLLSENMPWDKISQYLPNMKAKLVEFKKKCSPPSDSELENTKKSTLTAEALGKLPTQTLFGNTRPRSNSGSSSPDPNHSNLPSAHQ